MDLQLLFETALSWSTWLWSTWMTTPFSSDAEVVSRPFNEVNKCVIAPYGFGSGCGDCVFSLQWCHNGRDGVSNNQSYHYLLNRLFRHRSKKISILHVTGLCAGNSPVIGEFPTEMASNAENVSIWWRHYFCKILSQKNGSSFSGLAILSVVGFKKPFADVACE